MREFPNIRPLLEARLIEALMESSGKSREEVEPEARELMDFAERAGRELRESRDV